MPDPTIGMSFGKELLEGVKYLIVVILGLFGWNLRRQIDRLDKIEAEYVKDEHFTTAMRDLQAEIRQGFRDTHKRIDARLDGTRSRDTD